jgi:uncharacterized phage protein gp47/JayE
MSTFDIPTLDEQHAFLIALMKALLPLADVSELTPNWLWTRTQAGGATDNHAHISNVENDLLPDTAIDDMQDRWGTILGVPRKAATPARKDKALRVTGTVATPVPNGQQLRHTSGLIFAINGAGFAVGAGGYVDCDVVAIDTGSATRLNAGETLTFLATPAGLNDDAELQLDLDEDGTDKESNGAYQIRILNRLSNPPLGGAQNDYVQWALDQAGIAAAFCYPVRAGTGSVDLAALHEGSGNARVLLAGEVTALQAAIAALKPVAVTFRVLTVVPRAVNVEYKFLPDGDVQSECDWNDAVAPLVLAWQPGGVARKLQFQGGTRPPDMVPGMRIIHHAIAGGSTGQEFVIESLSGADAVILETAPNPAPVNNDVIYSGGPLVQPIRAAIQALIDSLGTANPDTKRYGAWEGNLRPGSIDRVSRSIEGVLDGVVVLPAAVEQAVDFAFPAYIPPNDNQVELLIAGEILVHRNH